MKTKGYTNEERICEKSRAYYLEIKDHFNQASEKIIDSRGERWLKCKHCNDILPQGAFIKLNVNNDVNLGVCLMCYHELNLNKNKELKK